MLALAVCLAGCTTEAPSEQHAAQGAAEPPAQQNSSSIPTDQENPGVVPDGCEGLGASGLTAVPNDVEDRVHGYVVTHARDAGSREHASGQTVLDEEGVPVAYVVAEGDTAVSIADRFCIGFVDYLGWINSVRRDGVSELYPGDTLNLDRFAITSVGDQAGHVQENEPGVHIPPQRPKA